MVGRISLVVLLLGLYGPVALAGSDEYSRIARISYLEGNVSFQHPNEVDWSAASINMALLPNDRIYTGDSSRAEVEFDDGSVLRLAEKTDVEILSLQEDLIQVRISLGLCSLTVQSSLAFEMSTPAAAFSTQKKGMYRFDVVEDGSTDAIVRKGRVEAANNFGTQHIDSGQLLHVTPTDRSTGAISRYEGRDAWDEWTDRRNADLTAHSSRRYIPDQVYMGVSELDQYGHWVVVDSYGPAWVPYYADAGWSPYWMGRWCYRPLWGWTWVSYEPWGWLPYHYGRWHHAGFGWCWLPGPSFGFNFWSPALVRFYYGPSWVSWCPLGPGDYYNVNHYYYNRANIHQINNIRLMQNRSPEDLANRSVPGAFRTVATQDFVSNSLGERVRNTRIETANQPWREGRMITDRLPVQPNTSSYAPAPDRPALRPTVDRGLPSIVRTMPAGDFAGRDRLVPIKGQTATSSPSSRSNGRTSPMGNSRGADRGVISSSGKDGAVVPSGGEAGRGSGTRTDSTTPSTWIRRGEGSEPTDREGGRTYQSTQPSAATTAPPAGAESAVTPGGSGRRLENPVGSGQDVKGTRPGIERPRPEDRDMPKVSNPRQESRPRTHVESAPAPRFERQAPQRSEPARPSPPSHPRPPRNEESNGGQPRTILGQPHSEQQAAASSVPTWSRVQGQAPSSGSAERSNINPPQASAVPATQQPVPETGRVYTTPAPHPVPQSTWGTGRAVYTAPAAPSGRTGWTGGSMGNPQPSGPNPASAPGFATGGAGIGRPRSR